ncbi:hypothetical protein KBK19_01505 [Microvirga sp. STR05]|uniref:DUF4369 domain-containing protein n=2 Tax=Hymenobacter TaxID=89966 RepID=A0A7G7W6Q7_9BACT|nr:MULTISPECIES: hypothetical protein [Hymenobacter]MBD2713704.1 hypothetical protein [Hymenobacter duratus]MBR7948606.1 hypothetical protein [Microvirga sp. STR05]QNH62050.1 hypothetical protein H4317_18195 [Hymenobacter sediminicola]
MKQFLYATAFLLPFASTAQQPDSSAAEASAKAVYRENNYVSFLPGTIRLLDGHLIQGYVPIPTMYPGIGTDFIYYRAHPKSKPKPKKQTVEISRVHSITAGAHYLETMLLPDGSDELYDQEILAERFVNGPVEVFLQAEAQSIPVPIPVAGSILGAAIPYTNSHFFVRRNGFLMQVYRGSFKEVMSQYLQDYPELAAKVRAGEKDYHYRNMISIITEFNAHIGSTSGTGQ